MFTKEFHPSRPTSISRGNTIPEELQKTKTAIEERYSLEHQPLTAPAGSDTGKARHIAGGCSMVHVSNVAPSNPVTGAMWYNSDTGFLYLYSGGVWIGGFGDLATTAHVGCYVTRPYYNTTTKVLAFQGETAPCYITNSNVYNPLTGEFKAPTAGWYHHSMAIYYQYTLPDYRGGDITTLRLVHYDSFGSILATHEYGKRSANIHNDNVQYTYTEEYTDTDGSTKVREITATVKSNEFIRGYLNAMMVINMSVGDSLKILLYNTDWAGVTTPITFLTSYDRINYANFALLRTT